MDVQIEILAVVLATISSFVVGFVWYAAPVFGNTWMKLVGLKESDIKMGPGTSAWFRTVLAAALQAFVLAHVTYLSYSFFDYSWMEAALSTAFWLWLGFQLSMVMTHDAFEQRPLKLTMLNAAHQLATLLVMGIVIGLFKP
jgi:hypothetical protein